MSKRLKVLFNTLRNMYMALSLYNSKDLSTPKT